MVVEDVLKYLIDDSSDAEDAVKKWKDIKKWSTRGLAGLLVLGSLCHSVYMVPTNSQGVVQRLGKYSSTKSSGLKAKIPFIDKVTKVPTQKMQIEEFGFRTLKQGVDTKYIGFEEIEKGEIGEGDLENLIESSGVERQGDLKSQAQSILQHEYLMLTGDLNMADVEWIVQYRITDPVAYLFNVADVKKTIRDASFSIMRRIIGNGSIDEAITIGRIENENMAKTELQEILKDYQTGVLINTVKLQSSNPPQKVRPAFNLVNEAMQTKEKRINEAMQEYNKEVPKATGEAQGVIEQANGYATKRINESKGDADKFLKILREYEKYPDVTKQRYLFETMTSVLPEVKKTIIDDGAFGKDGLYKIFKLESDGAVTK